MLLVTLHIFMKCFIFLLEKQGISFCEIFLWARLSSCRNLKNEKRPMLRQAVGLFVEDDDDDTKNRQTKIMFCRSRSYRTYQNDQKNTVKPLQRHKF